MVETIGWLGSIMLGICAYPQLVHTVKTRDTSGLSWGFLALWGFGEIFTLSYVVLNTNYPYQTFNYPLICNYALNCAIISVLVYFKYKGEKK